MTSILQDKLHSQAPVVVVEAPGGCGKTWTAAQFAKEMSARLMSGRVLLLSHTHAACGQFQKRCHGPGLRVDVETCDSFCLKIVAPYARVLGLPHPLELYLGREPAGVPFSVLSEKAVELLSRSPTIARTIAECYPTIILDEHQDSSNAQHKMIMLLREIGLAKLRIFGDPMQAIHAGAGDDQINWSAVAAAADERGTLVTPHRWRDCPELGDWIMEARTQLKAGSPVALAGTPDSVRVQTVVNLAGRNRIRDPKATSKLMKDFSRRGSGTAAVLVFLSPMTKSLAAVTGWSASVNEGAVLEHMNPLLAACENHPGEPGHLSHAFLDFLGEVGVGLTESLKVGLKRRLGASIDLNRTGHMQRAWLERFQPIYESPDHRGLARAMRQLHATPTSAYIVRLRDHAWSLRSLERADDPRAQLAVLGRLRRRRALPEYAISTIHRAKGLEFSRVLLCPVDENQYPSSSLGARLLYVALSRARMSLDLILDSAAPSGHVRP
ncbi:MAG TPA: ATP-dependent helicase [Thermoanaerobaculia bacterium]|jgi:DNA helicase-2/ATP-dependent DNA helicase PcrA|nr:ATP-dependent helicase [Thermoanaerobaculia bacterium]